MNLRLLALATILFCAGTACKKAAFENITDSKGSGNSSDDLNGNGGSTTRGLEVSVSSPEVKAGGDTIKATATTKDGVVTTDVTWEIKSPDGRTDIGTIDADGVYKSPATADKEFPVIITAVLKSDPTIRDSETIKVLPPTQVFARCTRNNVVFPILANVYEIPRTASAIPNFTDAAQARKVATVCMENYAVAPRDFNGGFPDVDALKEFFALQTTTTLVIATEGDYVFRMNSDDGSRLFIDGTEVINNDGLHNAFGSGPEESQTVGQKDATVRMKAGDHPLALNYFQGPKFRLALELKWKKPGSTNFEYVPREAFK